MSESTDFGDVLPDATSDDADLGWGDDPGRDDAADAEAAADADPDDLRRFLDERPPHHGE